MYDAAPVRPRKTDIVRSRGGCESCRKKRRKCDEAKPSCSRCKTRALTCQYSGVTLHFLDASSWAAEKVEKAKQGRFKERPKFLLAAIQRRDLSSSVDPERLKLRLDQEHQHSPSSPAWDSFGVNILHRNLSLSGNHGNLVGTRKPIISVSESDGSNDLQEGFPPDEVDISAGCQSGIAPKDFVALCRTYESTSNYSALQLTTLSSPFDGSSGQITNCVPILGNDEQLDGLSRHYPQSRCKIMRRAFADCELILERLSIPLGLNGSTMSRTDGIYLSHFMRVILRILPPNLDFLRDAAVSPEVVLKAALALGAANMANLKGTYTHSGPGLLNIVWSANPSHKLQALRYAEEALTIATKSISHDISPLVMAHVILLYVEVELGTFAGLRRYLASIYNLVDSQRHKLESCNSGRKLLCGVEHTHAVLRFVAGPWGSRQVESETLKLLMQPDIGTVSSSGFIHRLGNVALVAGLQFPTLHTLRTFRQRPTPALDILFRCSIELLPQRQTMMPDYNYMMETDFAEELDEMLGVLKTLARQLRKCQPPSGLPLGEGICMPFDAASSGKEHYNNIIPLKFKNHEQAMEAADYAYAQLCCDESHLVNFSSPSQTRDSRHPWLLVLMRIAAGISPSECAYRNKFRRGIGAMLIQGAFRCNDLGAFLFLETFMDRLIAAGTCWEDILSPIPVARQALIHIRQELERGRKLYVICSRLFSVEWNVLSTDCDNFLVLFGREADGTLFEEYNELYPKS